jgi:hypothetical protein
MVRAGFRLGLYISSRLTPFPRLSCLGVAHVSVEQDVVDVADKFDSSVWLSFVKALERRKCGADHMRACPGFQRAGIIASQSPKGVAASAAVRSAKAQKHASDILPIIEAAKAAGASSLRDIAEYLNQRRETAPRGGEWSAVQVSRVIGQAWSS